LSPRQGSVSLADLNQPSLVTLSHVKRKEPRPSFPKKNWRGFSMCAAHDPAPPARAPALHPAPPENPRKIATLEEIIDKTPMQQAQTAIKNIAKLSHPNWVCFADSTPIGTTPVNFFA
jgi:hypothetical protein